LNNEHPKDCVIDMVLEMQFAWSAFGLKVRKTCEAKTYFDRIAIRRGFVGGGFKALPNENYF